MLKRVPKHSIPLVLVAALSALVGWAYDRGTVATRTPSVPKSVDAEPVCEVVETPEDGKHVRACIRLPFSRERVWEVITDFENLGDICPYIRKPTLEYDPSRSVGMEARVQTAGSASLPLRVTIQKEKQLTRDLCSWDQPHGNVLVNRGRWEVTELGPEESLLVVTLEVEVRHIPTFFLRNVSLHRLRQVVLAVERRLRTGNSGQAW